MANQRAPGPRKPAKRRFRFGKLMIAMGITAAVAIVFALIGYMVIIYNGQKIYDENKDKMEMMEASIIFDANDNEVGVLARENRELVTKEEIPPLVSNAFIATEDRRFQEHAGVDVWAIGRALVKDVVARSAVEGGSTITQQLAKNMFLNSDKTFFRKGTEMAIALALDSNLEKDEILTLYLNRIYFGSGAYGIKAAAKVYFNKSDLSELELWEVATLAAIPKAPSTYSPIRNPDRSKERRAVVLKLMYDQGYITEEEKTAAQAVDFTPPPAKNAEFLAFTDYVVKEAEEQYQLEEEKIRSGGYKIYTTLNVEAQRIMEEAFTNPKLFQKDGPEQKMQGAMVILNNKDGGIAAMAGGRDYVNKGLNRVLVKQQPGSAFKPLIVYAPAIELEGYQPYSKLEDKDTSYDGYKPRNWDGKYTGEMDMFEAVRKSANAPAVWLLNQVGPSRATGFVSKMGITLDKQQDRNLSIALGGLTYGTTPLEMAQAYSAFPNYGTMYKAHSIRMIVDNDGDTIKAKVDKTKVMSPQTAYYMTELLRGVVERGTGAAAKMKRPAAGKTGTTQNVIRGLERMNKDVWFVGYTPEWTAAVWMGFDKPDKKHYVTPSSGSKPAAMFKYVFNKALANVPVKNFERPDGVPDLKEPPKSVTNLKAEFLPGELPKVLLTWSGEEGNANAAYQVFRKEAEEPDYKMILDAVQGTLEVNDISVLPGKTYEYYVVPYNAQTQLAGEKSNIAVVEIPEEAVPSPEPSSTPSESPAGEDPASPSPTPAEGEASPSPSPDVPVDGDDPIEEGGDLEPVPLLEEELPG